MSSPTLHFAERSYNVFRSGASYYARQAVKSVPEQSPLRPTSTPRLQPKHPHQHHHPRTQIKRPKLKDDIHHPSLGNSSLGHLISELSATKPGMESLRIEGQTMSEEQRTFARGVVKWVSGVPVLIGAGFVGGGLYRNGRLGF